MTLFFKIKIKIFILIIAILSYNVNAQEAYKEFSTDDFSKNLAKWIEKDNQRRGYTGYELTMMIHKVSS